MSEMQDAFDELSQRGTPRGFDDVLAGAAASAMHGTDDGDSGAGPGDLEPIPFVTSEARGRARRPFRAVITAAGVAALVLVSALAVSAVVGSGGSDSPEGAVRRLADALSHEDPLAAADVIAPDEVRTLHGTLDAAAHKAAELQLVQTAGAPLSGIDFNVSGLKLSTQSLGNGYSKVTVEGGTFSASTHKAKFSPLMQKALRNTDDNSSQADLSQLAGTHRLPTFVVVVRQGGSWYVSAAYTTLEYVREWNQLPAADFGAGERDVATLGADSPDAAVQDSVRALQRNDWTKLMTMVSPREIPFYDYRAAFNELIRKREAESAAPSTNFTIDAMTTNAQIDGDTAKVTLNASGTTDSGKWKLEGGCFTPPDTSTPAITCGEGDFLGLISTPYSALDKGSQFTAIKHGGRWFVSPVGTVLDVVDKWISTLDRRTLFTMIGIPNQLPPDGSLTLGSPFALNAANRHLQVLTFDGHKGQKLLGLAKSKLQPTDVRGLQGDFSATSARLFAPDGSELTDSYGLFDGQPVALPADGTYTVAVQSYGLSGGGDVTVTIWNAADAPAAAKNPVGMNGSCTYSGLVQSCSSSSAVATAPSNGTSGQLGLNPIPALCDANGQAGVGGNLSVLGADGKPLLDEKGAPLTLPAGTDLTSLCATIKNSGQNGGGDIVSGSGTASVGTTAVGPAATAVAVPTSNG